MSPLLPRRAVSAALAAGLLGGALVGFSFADELRPAAAPGAVAAAELDRAPLPAGSDERGLTGVERTALDLAAALDAVPVRAGGDESTRYCPRSDLRVRWTAPAPGEFSVGGHIEPVGPAPGPDTDEVNGLVVCAGASYAYMGFEARWDGTSWALAAVPALSDEHELAAEQGHERVHEPAPVAEKPAPRRAAPAPRRQVAPRAAVRGFTVPPVDGIDPYAAYDPQRICDPVAKPGTAALRDLLLRTYPGSRNLGVSRTCTARGTSEHKEGRAFDWGVNKGVPAERAAAEGLLAQLLATDAAGHRHALARRLGVMYLIWDRQIWSAYSADRGWRPYSGANAHTDHVHLSLSWDGAMGRTSYWSGANATLLKADPDLQLAPGSPPVGGGGQSGEDGPRTKEARWTRDPAGRTPAPRPTGELDGAEQRDEVEQSWWQERRDGWERERRSRAERKQQQRAERRSSRRDDADEEIAVTSLTVVAAAPTDVPSARPVTEPTVAMPARVERPTPTTERKKIERPKVERKKSERPRTERKKSERPRVERKQTERKKVERKRTERSATPRARTGTSGGKGRKG